MQCPREWVVIGESYQIFISTAYGKHILILLHIFHLNKCLLFVFFFSRKYRNLSWEWWWLSKESLVHSIRSIWTSWPIQLKYWEIGRQVRDVETSRNLSFSYITKRWQGFCLFRSSRVKMQFYIFERFHYAFLQQDLIIPQEQALSASSERHFTYCKHENHSQ